MALKWEHPPPVLNATLKALWIMLMILYFVVVFYVVVSNTTNNAASWIIIVSYLCLASITIAAHLKIQVPKPIWDDKPWTERKQKKRGGRPFC